MIVWIDLSNSPHPLLFAPIAQRLEELGHDVRVTARDNAQTVDLARARCLDTEVIGGASPAGSRAKAAVMRRRVHALIMWARAVRPDVALSHNSYAQIVAARVLGIRAVTAMDFEHQPANHVGFRLAQAVLLPAVTAGPTVRRQGATAGKARFYDGLKEEVYVGDFEPDPEVLRRVGIERSDGAAVVVARTPPSGALYHRFGNPLFEAAVRAVGGQRHVHCVVLTRHPAQRCAIESLRLGNVVAPERAVDSRSLMWSADLVLGAGGTMTREATLLGAPTFSLFAGREPAVDRWLIERGRLRRLDSPAQLESVRPRSSPLMDLAPLRERSARLVSTFVRATLEGSEARSRSHVVLTQAHG
jgi:predicted glycosyltransferase